MNDREEVLKKRMAEAPSEELKMIILEEADQYEEDAINFAKKELMRRNEYDFESAVKKDSEIKILKDVLDRVTFEELELAILKYFPGQETKLDKYRAFYEKLKIIEPSIENKDYINVGFEGRGIIVVGEEAEGGEYYSPELCRWNDWLSFKIKSEQLENIENADFLVHCIMTMTVYGFNESRIERKLKQIEEGIEELNSEDEDIDEE